MVASPIKPFHRERLWTFPYIASLFLTLSSNTITSMLVSTLPLFIQTRGGSPAEAGLMVTLFTFSVLLIRPFAGYLIDHIGRKPVLLVGFVLVLLPCVGYYLQPGTSLIGVLRVLQGIGFGLQTTAIATIFADIVPPRRRAEGLGYSGVVSSLTSAIGPAIGLWLMATAHFGILALVALLLCLSGLILGVVLRPSRQHDSPQKDARQTADGQLLDTKRGGAARILDRLIEKSAVPAAIVLFFLAFDYAAILTFLSPYAASKNIPDISLFFWIYAVCMLLSRPLINWVSKRIGVRRIIVPGNLFLLASFVLLIFAANMTHFILAAVAFGIGFGIGQPALITIITDLAPVHRRGVANATFFIAMDLGIGLGAVVWAAISQALNYQAVFVGASAGIILSCLAYYLLLRLQLKRRITTS